MSITTYFEKKEDGTMVIREIEEKVREYHTDALNTAIKNEKDANKLAILKQAREIREDKKAQKINSKELVKKHKEALSEKIVK